jgi:hypothetical protein
LAADEPLVGLITRRMEVQVLFPILRPFGAAGLVGWLALFSIALDIKVT